MPTTLRAFAFPIPGKGIASGVVPESLTQAEREILLALFRVWLLASPPGARAEGRV